MKCNLQLVKKVLEQIKNENVDITFFEDSIQINKTFRTSIITLSYVGHIEMRKVPTKYNDNMIDCIIFNFDQEDTGKFDLAKSLKSIVLIDRKVSELDFSNWNKDVKKTKNIKSFINEIIKCLN